MSAHIVARRALFIGVTVVCWASYSCPRASTAQHVNVIVLFSRSSGRPRWLAENHPKAAPSIFTRRVAGHFPSTSVTGSSSNSDEEVGDGIPRLPRGIGTRAKARHYGNRRRISACRVAALRDQVHPARWRNVHENRTRLGLLATMVPQNVSSTISRRHARETRGFDKCLSPRSA